MGNLKPDVFDQTDALAFVGWAIFGELFYDKLAQEYQDGNYEPDANSPLLAISLLNEIIDESYGHFDFSDYSYSDDGTEEEGLF